VQNNARNYNIFTQWKFTLPAQQLSMTAGASLNFVRFGTQNLIDSLKTIFLNAPVLTQAFKPVLTPNLNILKAFNDNTAIYANVAFGYTPPTISQMINTAGVVDASLKPERAVQYEAGTKGTLGSEQQFAYQAAIFDLDITNRLTQVTANSISYYTNVGEQRNLGIEFYGSYSIVNDKDASLTLLRTWVSYTSLDAKYVNFTTYKASGTGDVAAADYSNNKVAAVSPNVLNAGIDAATKIGFYLSASYQYVDKAPVTFDNSTYMKSYDLLRARIGYKQSFGRHFTADVFAGGDNLLGSTYYSFLFVGQNIQELAQGTDTFVKGGGGDGYILPAPYKATFYGGASLSYKF
jgi:iron complex outermembrane receptor protein